VSILPGVCIWGNVGYMLVLMNKSNDYDGGSIHVV